MLARTCRKSDRLGRHDASTRTAAHLRHRQRRWRSHRQAPGLHSPRAPPRPGIPPAAQQHTTHTHTHNCQGRGGSHAFRAHYGLNRLYSKPTCQDTCETCVSATAAQTHINQSLSTAGTHRRPSKPTLARVQLSPSSSWPRTYRRWLAGCTDSTSNTLSFSMASVSVLQAFTGCRFLRARLLRRSPAARRQQTHMHECHCSWQLSPALHPLHVL